MSFPLPLWERVPGGRVRGTRHFIFIIYPSPPLRGCLSRKGRGEERESTTFPIRRVGVTYATTPFQKRENNESPFFKGGNNLGLPLQRG